MLPPDVMGELAKLQDRIEPFPTDQVCAVLLCCTMSMRRTQLPVSSAPVRFSYMPGTCGMPPTCCPFPLAPVLKVAAVPHTCITAWSTGKPERVHLLPLPVKARTVVEKELRAAFGSPNPRCCW